MYIYIHIEYIDIDIDRYSQREIHSVSFVALRNLTAVLS